METTMMNSSGRLLPHAAREQRGFTLIEVLISIVVITVGLVALLGAFSVGMAATQTSKQDMIAKQIAQEAMESLVTARETANSTWDEIQNVGPGSGIFVTGLQPVRQAGADGIIGTIDDGAAQMEYMQEPGADGIVGTADDPPATQLTGFRRSITITNAATGDLRNVNITVQYSTPQQKNRTYVLSGMISQYR